MIDQNLKALRQRCGYTMEGLAEKIGVTRQAVAKWENGESVPDLQNAKALADLYDVSLDALVRGSVDTLIGEQDGETKFLFGVVTIDDQYRITLPEKPRSVFRLHPGDELLVVGDKRKGMAMVKINGTADFFRMDQDEKGTSE